MFHGSLEKWLSLRSISIGLKYSRRYFCSFHLFIVYLLTEKKKPGNNKLLLNVTGPKVMGTKSYGNQKLQGPKVMGTKSYRNQKLREPKVTGTKSYGKQKLREPKFTFHVNFPQVTMSINRPPIF